MKDIKNIFRGLEKLLKEAKWFDEDWEIYNRGPYLQLYKTTWFNHNQGGVHFETVSYTHLTLPTIYSV